MATKPTISIITPVWNGLPYVQECVASVLAQDFQDWEMLIGDNVSDDGTREYLDTLTDPRIRVFKQAKNLHTYGNLNFLFAQARAPITQVLCADDYLIPSGLGRIVNAWAQAPAEIGLIRFHTPSDDQRPLRAKVQDRPIPTDAAPLYFFLFGSLCGNLSNVSLRTHLVAELGGFPTDLPFIGDTAFWVRLASRHPMQVSPETVNYVRRHPGAASNYLNRNGELAGEEFMLIAALFEQIKADYPEWLLRLHATVGYEANHRDAGVKKLLLRGNGDYLRNVQAADRRYPIFLGPAGRWLVYFLTLGGRVGAQLPARAILRRSFIKHRDASRSD